MERNILMIIATAFLFGGLTIFISSFVMQDKSKVRGLWRLYLTEFVIVGLVLLPAFVGGAFFAGVMALVGLRALWEFYALYGPKSVSSQKIGVNASRAKPPRARSASEVFPPEQVPKFPIIFKIVGAIAGFALFASAYWFDHTAPMLSILPLAALVLLSINIFIPVSAETSKHLSLTLLGIIYPCLFLAHIILIEKMPNGFVSIFFMYAIAETHDSAAQLLGTLFGRHKIFPQLSPKKTYEGSFFGICFALLMAVVLSFFVTNWSILQSIGAALVIVLFTLFGDLAASKLKRDVGVKDFGNVLPKQGGILDIYDSLIFVSPVFYLFLQATSVGVAFWSR